MLEIKDHSQFQRLENERKKKELIDLIGSKKSEYDHFLGLLRSGEFIKRDELSEILSIIEDDRKLIKYILKAEYRYTYRDSFENETHWFQYSCYTLILSSALCLNNFKVCYIDEDKGTDIFISRNVQIQDIARKRYYTYKSVIPAPYFIEQELLPLLEKLNQYGSWEDFYLANDCISPYGEREVRELYIEIKKIRDTLTRYDKEREYFLSEKDDFKKEKEHLKKEKADFERLKAEELKKLNLYKQEHALKRSNLYGEQDAQLDLKSLLSMRDKLLEELKELKDKFKLKDAENQLLKNANDKMYAILNSKLELFKQLFK